MFSSPLVVWFLFMKIDVSYVLILDPTRGFFIELTSKQDTFGYKVHSGVMETPPALS